MFTIVSGIAAILFATVWGGAHFGGAVLFAILGLCGFGKVAGVRLRHSACAYFVLLIVLGALGELTALFSAETGGLSAAWLLFLPSLGITFFSGGIGGAVRKVTAVLYLCLVMLLHMHARGAENTAHCFLSMEIAGLFVAIRSTAVFQKRKNDA